MEYEILKCWCNESLSKMVSKRLNAGWQLAGGVSMGMTEHRYNTTYSYSQAMTYTPPPATAAPATAAPATAAPATAAPATMMNENMYYHDEDGQKCYYTVEKCPGIGPKTKKCMARYKIFYLYELVGQFMCLQLDKAIFSEWLKDNFETMNNKDIERCVNSIAMGVSPQSLEN
jgi:hypothetical protein